MPHLTLLFLLLPHVATSLSPQLSIGATASSFCLISSSSIVEICFGSSALDSLVNSHVEPDPYPGSLVIGDLDTACFIAPLLGGSPGAASSVSCMGSALASSVGAQPETIFSVTLPMPAYSMVSGNGSTFCTIVAPEGSAGTYGIQASTACFGPMYPTGVTTDLLPTYAAFTSYTPDFFIVTGPTHSCIIIVILTDSSGMPTDNEQIFCFGDNSRGQLGVPSITSVPDISSATQVSLGTNLNVKNPYALYALQVSVGNLFTCAILTWGGKLTGGVKCWGAQFYNVLGNERFSGSIGSESGDMGDALPFIYTGLLGSDQGSVSLISSGYEHSCVIYKKSSVWCWGSNAYFQLGSSDPAEFEFAPNLLIEGASAVALTCGLSFTAVLLSDNALVGFGSGSNGQLGASTLSTANSPMCIYKCPITLKPTPFPISPSSKPSHRPTGLPTHVPTRQPTAHPSTSNSKPIPPATIRPILEPTSKPTLKPLTSAPTRNSSALPTLMPTATTNVPTNRPADPLSTLRPTTKALIHGPSAFPAHVPTKLPTTTAVPTKRPTDRPSMHPTTHSPTNRTISPTKPTAMPTHRPGHSPSQAPSSSSPTTASPTHRHKPIHKTTARAPTNRVT